MIREGILYFILGITLAILMPFVWNTGKHYTFAKGIEDMELMPYVSDISLSVVSDRPMGNGCTATVYGYLENSEYFIALDIAHFPPNKLKKNITWGLESHVPNGEYTLNVYVHNECGILDKKVPMAPIQVNLGRTI